VDRLVQILSRFADALPDRARLCERLRPAEGGEVVETDLYRHGAAFPFRASQTHGDAVCESQQFGPQELAIGDVDVECLLVTDALLDPLRLDGACILTARELGDARTERCADGTIEHLLRRLPDIADGADAA